MRDQKLRITIVHVNGEGTLAGGFRVMADYAHHLARQGHDVALVTPPRPRVKRFPRSFLRRLPLYRHVPPRTDFLDGRGLDNRVLTDHRPVRADDLPDADVLVGTWWETMEWVADMPPSKGRPVHLCQGYEVFPYLPQDRARAVLDLDVPKVAVSGWVRDKLVQEHGAKAVRVVLNGVDTGEGSARPSPPPRPRFGFVYSSQDIKNADLAFAAFEVARRARPDLDLVAFGQHAPPARDRAALTAFAEKPSPEAIDAIYAGCTGWLFPSTEEGFGLPILEAMAQGTPVIGTRAGAAPDLIGAANGALVDTDPDAMAAAILDLASKGEEDWATMSKNARATAEANSAERAAERFEDALYDVAAGRL